MNIFHSIWVLLVTSSVPFRPYYRVEEHTGLEDEFLVCTDDIRHVKAHQGLLRAGVK